MITMSLIPLPVCWGNIGVVEALGSNKRHNWCRSFKYLSQPTWTLLPPSKAQLVRLHHDHGGGGFSGSASDVLRHKVVCPSGHQQSRVKPPSGCQPEQHASVFV